MTIEQIVEWAAHPDHHHPQLVLAPGLILGAGQVAWSLFLALATDERIGLLVARIELWDERADVQGVVERGKEIA